MKQIDEILDNLAKSIGSKFSIVTEGLDTYVGIDGVYFCKGSLSKIISAKFKFLHGISLFMSRIEYRGESYQLNSEKLIFEPVKKEIMPCIYCQWQCGTQCISENDGIFIDCTNCKYRSEQFGTREHAINAHNEIYRKVHGK
jgi:hypothetical protein